VKLWMWAGLVGLVGVVYYYMKMSGTLPASQSEFTPGDTVPGVKSAPSSNPLVSKLATGINKDPNKVYSPFRINTAYPYGTVLHTETATTWRT